MQIVSIGDNLREMSNPNKKNIINVSSAELAQGVVKAKSVVFCDPSVSVTMYDQEIPRSVLSGVSLISYLSSLYTIFSQSIEIIGHRIGHLIRVYFVCHSSSCC